MLYESASPQAINFQALTSQVTNESSDSDLTELTTGTSLKTYGSSVADPLNTAKGESTAHASRLPEGNTIRQQYDCPPETVPDVKAEMEKWFAMADR